MKKLLYYLILVAIFATLLFLCSFIVTLLFKEPGSFVMILMCAVVIGGVKYIQPIIKRKMDI